MQIHTSLIPSIPLVQTSIDVAVVIDVLRATSVATTALAMGATEIVTCLEVDQARSIAAAAPVNTLLCGERGCKPIEGFDLGNSPAEYAADRVSGKRLILTTTNGTLAVESAAMAKSMILASFLNLSAIVDAIRDAEHVQLCCAGTNGQVTGEDVMLAGAIIDRCRTLNIQRCDVCDASAIARQWWLGDRQIPDSTSLVRRFRETAGGQNLVAAGYEADLARCAAIDSVPVVPRRSNVHPATFVAE